MAENGSRPGKEGRRLRSDRVMDLTRAPRDGGTFVLRFRLLALGLALPLLHLAAVQLGLLGTGSPRYEWVVVTWILLFGSLAAVRHYQVEKRAQKLWRERLEFEKAVKSSRNDLRVIVERARAEEARRLAQEKFSIAFEVCPYAITIQRLDDGTYLEVNPAFERILGYERHAVLGRSIRDLGLWPDPAREERLRRATQRRYLRERRVVVRTRSGDERVLLLSAGRARFEGQAVLLSISRDVTEQARIEESLRSTADLLYRARMAIFAVDSEGSIRYWNDLAETLLGWTTEDAVGHRAGELLVPRSATGPFEGFESIDREGTWSGEVLLRDKTGRTVRLDGWGTRVTDARGSAAFRLLFLDVGVEAAR